MGVFGVMLGLTVMQKKEFGSYPGQLLFLKGFYFTLQENVK